MNWLRFSPLLNLLAAGGLIFSMSACSYLPFRHKEKPVSAKPDYAGKKVSSQGLVTELLSAPEPLKLGEVRQINVTFRLRNVSKKTTTLKFPTTQTIEILLRDPNNGQIVSQWSSERAFTSNQRFVVINPQERIEYNEPITTRELKAGKAYTLEAYVVGYENELRITKAILPQPWTRRTHPFLFLGQPCTFSAIITPIPRHTVSSVIHQSCYNPGWTPRAKKG